MRAMLLIGVFAGFLSINSPIVLASEIKVGGGVDACSVFFAPLTEPFLDAAGILLNVTASTPSQGLIELNNGKIDIATAAVPFESMIEGAAKSGVKIDTSLFVVREVGSIKTLVFTNKNSKVTRLSKQQLQDIFTGKVTNWKQVGGADVEIFVGWAAGTTSQNAIFSKVMLDGMPVTAKRKKLTDYVSIRDFVAKTPGAIGIAPQGYKSSFTWNPETPPVTTPAIAITKAKPSADVEKLLLFVQEHVKEIF